MRGFSLVELLVVIAILAILTAISAASYLGFRNKQSVEVEIMEIRAIIRETMELSKSQADGSGWGVHFANPAGSGNDFYEVWKGTGYASSTVTRRFNLSENLRFTDPPDGTTKDIIFERATGLLSASSSIGVESLSGGGSGTVNVDTSGRVDYTLN